MTTLIPQQFSYILTSAKQLTTSTAINELPYVLIVFEKTSKHASAETREHPKFPKAILSSAPQHFNFNTIFIFISF